MTEAILKNHPRKKECPPGKVLSPKGRCVIVSNTKKSSGKKECPPKVLSPKGRCVKRGLPKKNITNNNRYIIKKKLKFLKTKMLVQI